MDITLDQLTTGQISGTGVFDQLMAATKAHIREEYSAQRIKGTEYATVYLGSLQACMQTALQFVLTKDKTEKEVELLDAQICKLKAEYDLLLEQIKKTAAETALLAQKKITEMAQVVATGVDADSVIGRQKALYLAQTDGYARDAEQKAAKIVADLMSVQMSVTDYEASDTNKITDTYLGSVMSTLYSGIGASAITNEKLLTGGVLSTTEQFTNTTMSGNYGSLVLTVGGSWVYTAKEEYESVGPNVVLEDTFQIFSTASVEYNLTVRILGYEGNTLIKASLA